MQKLNKHLALRASDPSYAAGLLPIFIFALGLLLAGCQEKKDPSPMALLFQPELQHDFRSFNMGDLRDSCCLREEVRCHLTENALMLPKVDMHFDSIHGHLVFKREALQMIRLELFCPKSRLNKQFEIIRNYLNQQYAADKEHDRLNTWCGHSQRGNDMQTSLSIDPIGLSGQSYISITLLEENGICE